MTTPEQYIVLLVEDNPNDLLFIQRAIRKANLPFSLYVVENGEVAVTYLLGQGFYANREQYPFQALIITNMKMPRMNGLELLRWVKQQPNLKHLPVLVMSSSDDPYEMNQVITLGCSAYFAKTVNLNLLTAVVIRMMSFLPPLNQQP